MEHTTENKVENKYSSVVIAIVVTLAMGGWIWWTTGAFNSLFAPQAAEVTTATSTATSTF